MGSALDIELDNPSGCFAPGEAIQGTASWQLGSLPNALELRLLWHTSGKAEPAIGLVQNITLSPQQPAGRERFRLQLPREPYSFRGQHIRLQWAIELVVFPGLQTCRLEIVMGPEGREVVIPHKPDIWHRPPPAGTTPSTT